MNTYSKFVPNVYLAKCSQQYEKGSVIELTTKYGSVNKHIVFNLIYQKDGFFYYSTVREDGYNLQERAKRRAERYNTWASKSEQKSTIYWKRSHKDSDFLRLCEPIKVGHHSEKWHRKVLKQSWDNMGKSVELSKKANDQKYKSKIWEQKVTDINLSIPESLDFYQIELEKAKEYHEGLKSGKYERSHSFSLTYAKKTVNELTKKVELAKRLWA